MPAALRGIHKTKSNKTTGAGRETRTLMVSPPADFESAASTDSAIPAIGRDVER